MPRRQRYPTPGPGYYEVGSAAWCDCQPQQQAPFGSSSRRSTFEAAQSNTGPGQYNVSNYRSVGCEWRSSPNATAHAGTHTFIYRAKRRTLHESPDYTPPPGAYEVKDSWSHRGSESAFRSGSPQRAQQTRSGTPGAGAYDVREGAISDRGTSAAFKSKERRFRDDEPSGPLGPGAYEAHEYHSMSRGMRLLRPTRAPAAVLVCVCDLREQLPKGRRPSARARG